MKYFFDNGKDIGLKADIKRHNEEEKELISKYNSAQCQRLKTLISISCTNSIYRKML